MSTTHASDPTTTLEAAISPPGPGDVQIGLVPDRSAAADRPVIAFDRSLWVWVAVCSVVMLAGVGGGVWLVTGRLVDGLAVGGFTTFWGGPGFGIMFGSAFHALSTERAEKRAARDEGAAGAATPR